MTTYVNTEALAGLLAKQVDFQQGRPFVSGQRITDDCALILNNLGRVLDVVAELQEYAGLSADSADIVLPEIAPEPVHAHPPSQDPPVLSGEEASALLSRLGFKTDDDEEGERDQ